MADRAYADEQYIERRRTQAYWYAVGWADACGETDVAQEFSIYAMREAEAYRAEQVTYLPSIPAQWEAFSEALDELAREDD